MIVCEFVRSKLSEEHTLTRTHCALTTQNNNTNHDDDKTNQTNKQPDYQFVPSAVFCQPPLASVGFSEEEAAAKLSGNVDVYTSK